MKFIAQKHNIMTLSPVMKFILNSYILNGFAPGFALIERLKANKKCLHASLHGCLEWVCRMHECVEFIFGHLFYTTTCSGFLLYGHKKSFLFNSI